jgi:PAS domain S-box-containing protein
MLLNMAFAANSFFDSAIMTPMQEMPSEDGAAAGGEREELLAELARERARLKELNDSLEAQVEARTRALQEANRELGQAHQRFLTLFRTNPIPIGLTRVADGQVVDANEAMLDYFGLTREEAIGRSPVALGLWRQPAHREELRAALFAPGAGAQRGVEVEFRTRRGENKTALTTAALLEVGGERLILTSFLDITERRAAEARIRQLASEVALAEERERQRIGAILHDEVQQTIVALRVTLGLAIDEAAGVTAERLREADRYVADLLQTTRDLTAELSGPAALQPRLADSFAWLAGQMVERFGLQVAVEAPGDWTIPAAELRALVVRMVRELLFNVVKHAGVGQARLRLAECPGGLLIEVSDDGRGFDPATLDQAGRASGFGLATLGERLALLGGRLEVNARPGAGSRIAITIPPAALG